MQMKKNEIWVGIFLLATLLAALSIYLKVANVTSACIEPTYTLYTAFGDIGGLRARSPVSIGGVAVDRMTDITLDPKTYLSRVTLEIRQRYNHVPNTSLLNIRASDLLGKRYLALNVGFEDSELGAVILKGGNTTQDTKSTMVLEDLVDQFPYGSKDDDDKNSDDVPAAAPGNNETTGPVGTVK